MAVHTKTVFFYIGGAILLFGIGAGLAWASEQGWFGKEVFPNDPEEVVEATPSARPTATAIPRSGRAYTIQPGDTISSIATANGIDFETLAEHNDIPYPYNLGTGQTIYVPE